MPFLMPFVVLLLFPIWIPNALIGAGVYAYMEGEERYAPVIAWLKACPPALRVWGVDLQMWPWVLWKARNEFVEGRK